MVAREWVKSSEASSQEQTSFVSSEKSRKMTLEAGSWVAVGVNQLWRGEVAQVAFYNSMSRADLCCSANA